MVLRHGRGGGRKGWRKRERQQRTLFEGDGGEREGAVRRKEEEREKGDEGEEMRDMSIGEDMRR